MNVNRIVLALLVTIAPLREGYDEATALIHRLWFGNTNHDLLVVLPSDPSGAQVAAGTGISGMTFARASATTCKASTGYATLTSNQPCIQTDGVHIEAGFTVGNGASSDPSDAYWTYNGASVASGGPTGPGGAASYTVTVAASFDNHRLYHGAEGDHVAHTAFIDAKAGTYGFVSLHMGENVVTCDLTTGVVVPVDSLPASAAGWWNASIEDLGNGWFRCRISDDGSNGGGFFIACFGDTSHNAYLCNYSAAGGTVHVAGLQWNRNIQPASFLASTDEGTAARASDTGYFANPLSNSNTSWCLRVNATPDEILWHARGASIGLAQLGTTAGAANTAGLSVNSTGHLVFSVVDTNGDAKTLTSTKIVLAGKRTFRACSTSGTLSLTTDGQAIVTAAGGTGTGIISTMPARAYFGSLGAGSQLGGRWSRACVGNSATSCAVSSGYTPRFTAQTFAVVGDSITSCPGPATCWPSLLQTANPLWTFDNFAMGGSTATTQLGVWRASILGQGYQYVAQMTGINDSNAGVTAAIQHRMWMEIEADGAKPFIIADTPTGSTDSNLQTFYGVVRADESTYASDRGLVYADAWTPLVDPDNSPKIEHSFLRDDQVDLVHLNQLGETTVAEVVSDGLDIAVGTSVWVLHNGAQAGDIATGTLAASDSTTVTDTRASQKMCINGSGLTYLANDGICTEPRGLFVEGSAKNYRAHGQNFAAWSDTGTTMTAGLGPDGVLVGMITTMTGGSSIHHSAWGDSAPSTDWSESVDVKDSDVPFITIGVVGLESHYVTCDAHTGTVVAAVGAVGYIRALGGSWYRCGAILPGASAVFIQAYQLSFGDTAPHAIPGTTWSGDGLTALFANPSKDTDHAWEGSEIITYTNEDPPTRATDDVELDNPLQNSWTTFCTGARVRTLRSDYTGTRGIVAAGAGADSFSLTLVEGVPTFTVKDHTNTSKTFTAGSAISTSLHTVYACNVAGTLTVKVDGLTVTGSTTGAGSGQMLTQPSTAFLGETAAGTNPLWGWADKVCFSDNTSSCF